MRNLYLLTACLMTMLLLSSCVKENLGLEEFSTDISGTLSKYEIVTLDSDKLLSKLERYGDRATIINLDIATKADWEFTLSKLNLKEFAPSSKTYLVGADNQKKEVEAAKLTVFEGRHLQSDRPTFFVFGAHGFEASIIAPNGTEFYLEPLKNFDKMASDNQYVLYDEHSIVVTENPVCELESEQYSQEENSGQNRAGWCHAVEVTQVVDFQFYANQFASNYSNTDSWVRTRLFFASRRYNTYNDFPLNLVDNVVYIYTNNINFPNAVSNSATFVRQFDDFNNAGWYDDSPVNYLWTGRNVAGVWGRADGIAKMCSSPADEYSFGERMATNFNSNNLMAHEIGHTMGAFHDNGSNNFMNAGWGSWNSSLGANAFNNLSNHVNNNNGCLYWKDCD